MCTIWGDEIRLKQHVHNIRRWFIFSSANNNVYNICTWSESWKSQDTKRFGLVRPSDRRASCKTWHVVLGTNLLVQLFMQTWKTNYQYQKRNKLTFLLQIKILVNDCNLRKAVPGWVRLSVCAPQTKTAHWPCEPGPQQLSSIIFGFSSEIVQASNHWCYNRCSWTSDTASLQVVSTPGAGSIWAGQRAIAKLKRQDGFFVPKRKR